MPMFAATLVPVVGFTGAAVDYSRGNSAKAAMQAALDSTALMLARNATHMNGRRSRLLPPRISPGCSTARRFTPSRSRRSSPSKSAIQPSRDWVGTMNTYFLAPSASPCSTFQHGRGQMGRDQAQVGLALDTTGSMASSGKLAALKTATHSLLTTLQNAAQTPGDIQVAIVPFATDVNVGTGNAGAPWIDWTSWNSAHGSWGGYQNQTGRPRTTTPGTAA